MSYEYRPWGPYDNDYVPYGGFEQDGEAGVTLFQFMGDTVNLYRVYHANDRQQLSQYALEHIAADAVNVMEGAGGGCSDWDIHQYRLERSDQLDAMIWGWVELSEREFVRRYRGIFPYVIDGTEEGAGEEFDRMREALECCVPELHPRVAFPGPEQLGNGSWIFFEGWLYDDYPQLVPGNVDGYWDEHDEDGLWDFRAKHAVERPY